MKSWLAFCSHNFTDLFSRSFRHVQELTTEPDMIQEIICNNPFYFYLYFINLKRRRSSFYFSKDQLVSFADLITFINYYKKAPLTYIHHIGSDQVGWVL